MEELKQTICVLYRKKYIPAIILVPVLVLVVSFVVFCVLVFGGNKTTFFEFDSKNSGYATMEVTYVMGPFAEETRNGRTINECYIAETPDEEWYIIAAETGTSLPVYGVDVSKQDILGLQAKTLKGHSCRIPNELANALVDFVDESEITDDNYSSYFGTHYLDTTDTGSKNRGVFYLIEAAVIALGIIALYKFLKGRSKLKKGLDELEQSGKLGEFCTDFAVSTPICSSNPLMVLSEHFLLDYSHKKGLSLIPLREIKNVYKSNMVNGVLTAEAHIVLEGESTVYHTLPFNKKKLKNVDIILSKLKETIGSREVK